MNIIDRFTTHLRDALSGGIRLASDLKNPAVEPAHLFFALINQKGSIAAEILQRFKIDLKIAEQAVLTLPASAPVPAAERQSAITGLLTPLAERGRLALEKAMLIAHDHAHPFVGTEHLLLALLEINDPLINEVVRASAAKLGEMMKQLSDVLHSAAQFPQIEEVEEVVERLAGRLRDVLPPDAPPKSDSGGKNSADSTTGKKDKPAAPKKTKKKESALDWFAVELTGAETQKNLDPVIGRGAEIERVIQILCRRTKNNPLLLGEPGVGKTAIVEGLAKRIAEGRVPDLLLTKKIYSLDLGLLIAGTIYRGEFEGRLRQVIEEVTDDPNIILFIDEIHNVVGAGSNSGNMDAANLLKPSLSRGKIRCIGATTPSEFKKYIESDAALERRFQPVFAREPSLSEATEILRGLKANYESYHNVIISDEAVVAAVGLSDRYLSGKFLPDKAIDLLDETAAAKRLLAKRSPLTDRLLKLESKLEKTTQAKEAAARDDRFKEAVALKQAEESLREQIKEALNDKAAKQRVPSGRVDAGDIAAQVAKIIGAKPGELLLNGPADLAPLENRLKNRIIGQDETIREVAALIRQSQLGLGSPDRPFASFMFVGESGVGKTELAKALAEALYQDKDALIKLDMSEFNESFGVSKLLGSPAGYVGYKDSNQFTDKLKLHPYSVVLFDEIDKAHRDVVKLLLQILENGEITDSGGKRISLRHAIIILTTSLGAEDAFKGGFGFSALGGPALGGGAQDGGAKGEDDSFRQQAIKRLVEKLKSHFTPEVINRIDKICLFNKLFERELAGIAELEINRFNERLLNYRTKVKASETVLSWLVENLPDKHSDAREVRRAVRSRVETLIAPVVLGKKIKPSYQLKIKAGHLTLR